MHEILNTMQTQNPNILIDEMNRFAFYILKIEICFEMPA